MSFPPTRSPLSTAAREELALEAAALMGKVELLSALQRPHHQDSLRRRPTGSA